MSAVAQIAQALGFADPGPWLIAAIPLGVTLALTLAAFVLLGYLRNRWPEGSRFRDLVEVVRLPVTCLVLLNGLLENLALVAPESLSSRLEGIETLQDLLIIAALLWVMVRYINRIEHNLDQRALREGAVKLPVVGDRVERGTIQLIFKVLRATVGVAVLLMVIQAFGVSVSGLLAFGGLGGIAVGFAARDLISNMFSGLRIFWSRPFDVGDWIKCAANNIEGVVEEIGWQVTRVRTFDRRPLYVPNEMLATSVIENPQRMTNRRIYEYFGVRYDDIKVMPAILEDVRSMLKGHDGIAQDQILMVNLDRYGASSVDFFIYCLTRTKDWQEYHTVKEEVLLSVAKIIESHGGEFAFPTRTVQVQAKPDDQAAGLPGAV